MHKYLKSIGFKRITPGDSEDDILDYVLTNPNSIRAKFISKKADESGIKHVEYRLPVNDIMRLVYCGEKYSDGHENMKYYFPEVVSNAESVVSALYFTKRMDNDSITVECEGEPKIGISLFFFLQNIGEYTDLHNDDEKFSEGRMYFVYLSGFSNNGKILLPVESLEGETKRVENIKNNLKKRSALIEQAKNGNEEAIETLTLEDIDKYAMVTERIKREDILSIVDTSFVPYGSENDMYTIVGYILRCEKVANKYTGEFIWCLDLSCNDVRMRICIHEDDLMGEPLPGRRFRGNIWLQGRVLFDINQLGS